MPTTQSKHVDPEVYTPAVLKEGREILEKYSANGEYKAGLAALKRQFKQWGVVWKQRIACDHVGVDETNREGMGVQAADAQTHGFEILSLGFAWEELHAWCKQLAPEKKDKQKSFNDELVKLSRGLLPPLKFLDYTTVGGSHTNCFFRQVKSRVRSLSPAFADASGNLDVERIVHGRPEFQDALENGLELYVLHGQAEAAWPGLSAFLQKALNTEAKKERSELEGMMGMWHRATLVPAASCDWDELAASAAKGLGFWTNYTKAMASFLQQHTGCLLEDLSRFILVLKAKGNLGGEFLWGLAKLQVKDHPIPHVAIATCMAQLMGPKVEDNFCRTIKSAHLTKLRSPQMKEKVLAAEAALEKSKGVVQALGVAEKTEAVYQLGMLNVRVIAQMLDLGTVYEKTKWESLESISEDCFRKFHWYINVCFIFRYIIEIMRGLIMPASGAFGQTCLTHVQSFSIRTA